MDTSIEKEEIDKIMESLYHLGEYFKESDSKPEAHLIGDALDKIWFLLSHNYRILNELQQYVKEHTH